MIALMDLLPSWLQLGGLLGVFFAGTVLWLCGRVLAGGRRTPELQLFPGWGPFSFAVTLWGVASQSSMRWPALFFLLLAPIALGVPRPRPPRQDAAPERGVVLLA